MRDSYTGGICDPNKATTCTKKIAITRQESTGIAGTQQDLNG